MGGVGCRSGRLVAAGALVVAGVVVPSVSQSLPSPAPDFCGALIEVRLPGGRTACTHGPDPAPPGVDWRVPVPLAGRSVAPKGLIVDDPVIPPTAPEASPSGVRCYGDGVSGYRVQAIYARPATDDLNGDFEEEPTPDRYAEALPFIRQWAGQVDAIFAESARRHGGVRHVRFVTNAECGLDVANVVLSTAGDENLGATMAELAAAGFNRPDRKYLVWMDSPPDLCGIAGYYPADDRPVAENFNNGGGAVPPLVARIDSGCWGLGDRGTSVEAHELMHSLGAVLPLAPHATPLGHCRDDHDRMCYSDAEPVTGLQGFDNEACPAADEALFDCGGDDYFNPAPPAGTHLASSWNTAFSRFLSEFDVPVPVRITGAGRPEGDLAPVGLEFSVTLGFPLPGPVQVGFGTGDGTAVAHADYEPMAGTVDFAPGETAKTISVPVFGDFLDESDETFTVALFAGDGFSLVGGPAVGTILDDDPKGQGYWLAARDGGIFAYADAGFVGSTGDRRLNQPIVGMAPTPSGLGYWLVAADGGVFSFGDATFQGSVGGMELNAPIVGLAPTPSGHGYWLVSGDGGVFAFGDATHWGSVSGLPLAAPVVAITPTPDGRGYWLVGGDGRIFEFGNAPYFGSTPQLNNPVVGAALGGGTESPPFGLWLVASDGGVFAFGPAGFFGSTGALRLNEPIVGMARTPSGNGYWLVASDGGIFAFGDAGFYGSTGALHLNQPVVGMAALPRP